jgi:hypothetical protein
VFVRVGAQVVNPEGKVNSSPATCFFAADPEHPPLVTSNAGLPDDGVAPPDVSTFMHSVTHSTVLFFNRNFLPCVSLAV